MKSKALPVAVFIAIVGCVLAVSANVTTSIVQKDLEQERYKRFHAEEQLQSTQTALDDAKARLAGIEKIVSSGQTSTDELKVQLENVVKERDELIKQVGELQPPSPPASSY